MISWENIKEKVPSIYSFITFRNESFGGLIFNPYLGIEVELDPLEAYIVRSIDSNIPYTIIEKEVHKKFNISLNDCQKRILKTVGKLLNMCAVFHDDNPRNQLLTSPEPIVIKENNSIPSFPTSVIWDVTYTCNLNCLHCLNNSGTPLKNELDTEQAIFLIDELAKAKVFYLSISGGEPFLRPDIIALLEYLSTKKMRVDIATNGIFIKDELLDSLRDLPIFQIQVSIDGIGETHDQFRGKKGAFKKSLENICKLRKEEIAVSISTTVTQKNLKQLNEIINLAYDLGCNGFKALSFLPAGRGQENFEQLKLDLEGHLLMSKILSNSSQQFVGKMSIKTETTYAFLLDKHTTVSCNYGHMGCSAGYNTLNIGADGSVYPCPFLHDFPIGNILDHSLKNLWEEAAVIKTLRNLRKQDFHEPCRSCDYSPEFCRGGCRAAAYLEFGDFYSVDPTCFHSIIKK
ncbi:MAG: radical SAM protein [Candidatus Hodarchaeota archaeon]